MKSDQLVIPKEDLWVLDRLAFVLSTRLVCGLDSVQERIAISRLLFGLQRLPQVTPGLNVSLGSNNKYVQIDGEGFCLSACTEDGHTAFRLQYFVGSNHCIRGFEHFEDDEKRDAIELRLNDLAEYLADEDTLDIEDYSTGDTVDCPPMKNSSAGIGW